MNRNQRIWRFKHWMKKHIPSHQMIHIIKRNYFNSKRWNYWISYFLWFSRRMLL